MGLSSVDILRTRGVLQMWTPNFLVQKYSDFSKFKVYPHRQEGEGVSQCEQGGREKF